MAMRKRFGVAALLALGLTVPVAAQDSASSGAQNEEPARPQRSLRVLENPYDLASFYRSRETYFGAPPLAGDPAYNLARFYRSQGAGPAGSPWGGAPFWAAGYGAGYGARPRGYLGYGYRHSIGDNGDIFLAVPFLAPVGPLSGAFFGY
jgi:hypothetical protein